MWADVPFRLPLMLGFSSPLIFYIASNLLNHPASSLIDISNVLAFHSGHIDEPLNVSQLVFSHSILYACIPSSEIKSTE
jgi:hypothetical protein